MDLVPPAVVAHTDQCAAWTSEILEQAMRNQIELIQQHGTTAVLHGRVSWADELVQEAPGLAAQLLAVAIHVAAQARMNEEGSP